MQFFPKNLNFIFICVVFIWYVAESSRHAASLSFDEDTKITASQAEMLAKFRERVGRKLPHKYMMEDIFLIRFLRARNFNMDRAQEMLFSNLKWRQDNSIDRIDEENWRDIEPDYPWNLNGTDKSGRPLVQIVLRDWDIRQAAVTGRRDRLARWIFKYFEDATKLVRKFQSDGKNVTQFTLMLDAEGFNPINHGCALCMPIYFTIASAYEQQYPGSIDKIHVVNTPEFFNVIIRLVWPLLSQDTRNALKIHGTERNSWRSILSKDISDNQLLPAFGGTMSNEI